MIIVELKGGIGNQLFQYATGRHVAIKNNDVLRLNVEKLYQADSLGDVYRPFALEKFNIKASIATRDEIKRLQYPYGIFSKMYRLFRSKILRQFFVDFVPTVLNKNGDRYLDGYYQSPLYFTAIRDTLLTELTLSQKPAPAISAYIDQISNTNSVSIHVRRGDYANDPRVLREFGLCSISYYGSAMDQISKTITSPVYFVFSDDKNWVMEHLDFRSQVFFVNDSTISDVEELYLMSLCRHNIIANSSFSWWGAWLNKNPNKIVISPTPWFNNHKYDQSLIPETWIQVKK